MSNVIKIENGHRKAFAARLEIYRKRRFKTMTAFAEMLEISIHRYRTWEKATAEPSIAMIIRICDLLDVTPNDLFYGNPKELAEPKPKTRKTTRPVNIRTGKRKAS